MIVDQVQRTFADGRCEVSARVRPWEGEGQRAWFSYPQEVAARGDADATPFLPPALNWCMGRREGLLIDGLVRGLDSDAQAIPAFRRASRAVARSMKEWDSAELRVAELQHQLLIANADHRP